MTAPLSRSLPLRIGLLLLAACLLAACGRKGPVRPLEQRLPAAAQNLGVSQKGKHFLVAWDIPEVNQDGTPLTDLEGFRVFKMSYDPAEDCPECRDTSSLLWVVDLDYLQEGRRVGQRIFLSDFELVPGSGYQYRVVPFNRKGQGGAPAVARRSFFIPPPAPEAPAATGHDRLVRLAWKHVDDERPGMEMLGYNVYRRRNGESFPARPLNLDPLTETAYEDFGLENDRTYLYAVRSVVRIRGKMVESALSETVEATPREGL